MNGFEIFVLILFFVGIIGSIVFLCIYCKSMKITKEKSQLYKDILTLNRKYSFKNISQNIKVSKTFTSKAQLDNFNILLYLEKDIKNRFDYYDKKIFEIIKQNNEYKRYRSEYFSLKLTDRNTFNNMNCKIKFLFFNYCEKRLFKKKLIKMNNQSFTISYQGSYTSPAGRNQYTDRDFVDFEKLFKLFDSIRTIKIINERKEQEKIEKRNREREELIQRREEVKQLKKEHDRLEKDISKANEINHKIQKLERIERNISERERILTSKEHEFKVATKNHIYTTNKNIAVSKQDIEFDELSITQKFKVLREMLDNGEITYEEYKTKRGEIL